MRYHIKPLLAVAVAIGALAGCGQTGPLYMPPETTPAPPAMADPGATSAKPAAQPTKAAP